MARHASFLSHVKAHVPDMLSLSLVDYIGEPACLLFFSGCNLRCPYCQNWKLREAREEDLVSLEEVLSAIQGNFLVTACKVTGGEPLLQVDALIELGKRIKTRGLKFGVDTNGTLPEGLGRLLPYLDLVSIDVKAPLNSVDYAEVTGTTPSEAYHIVESVRRSLSMLFDARGVYVDARTVIIPGLNDSIDKLNSVAEGLKGVGYLSKAKLGEASYTLMEFVSENAYSDEFKARGSTRADTLLELARLLDLPNVHVTHRALGFFIKVK